MSGRRWRPSDWLLESAARRLQGERADWARAMLAEAECCQSGRDRVAWAWGCWVASLRASAGLEAAYAAALLSGLGLMAGYEWSADESRATVVVLGSVALVLGALWPRRALLSGGLVGLVVTLVIGFEALSGLRPSYEHQAQTLAQSARWLVLLAPALCCAVLGARVGPALDGRSSGEAARDPAQAKMSSKAPQATLLFWVVKICATTVGETGGDAASMTLRLGYALATVMFGVLFAVALAAQLRARDYRPATYWLTVVATTTVGTVASDFMDRTLHLGYVVSSAVLLALLVCMLVAWRAATGRIEADRITSRRDEAFYWLTILVSNTLGTALGDFTADRTGLGLGFEAGALVFGGLIATVALLHLSRLVPRTILFWAAYVLTRPLGATLGDTLTKAHAQGGLAFGRILASLAIGAAMVLLLAAAPSLRRPART